MLRVKTVVGIILIVGVACIPAQATNKPTRQTAVVPIYPGTYQTVTGAGWAPTMPKAIKLRLSGARQLASSTARCKTKKRWARRQFKNPLGMVLWQYFMQIEFCHRKGVITYYRQLRWADVSSVTPYLQWKPWEFKGHTGGWVHGGRASKEAWTQGHFQVCLIGDFLSPLCNNQFPQLSIIVRGDGTWSAWTKG